MFKFLLKIIIVAAIVAVAGGYFASKKGLMPGLLSGYVDPQALAKLSATGASSIGAQLSSTLDSLVTHPDRNSPVILGLKVSNDSLNAVVDLIQRLPPDQIDQLKQSICAPASPAASN